MRVFSKAMALALIGLFGLAGCAESPEGSSLPYYLSADFTPHWDSDDADLPRIAPRVAAFDFVDQAGDRFGSEDVAGKIYVANFFFVRCSGICPLMATQLSRVLAAFQDDPDVVLVSHSVTPSMDTVPILEHYAAANQIDAKTWRLLTGDRDEIYRLARGSYFAESNAELESTENDFLHTENVVLVDRVGRLRGVYNGTLPLDMARLIEDIRTLKSESA